MSNSKHVQLIQTLNFERNNFAFLKDIAGMIILKVMFWFSQIFFTPHAIVDVSIYHCATTTIIQLFLTIYKA